MLCILLIIFLNVTYIFCYIPVPSASSLFCVMNVCLRKMFLTFAIPIAAWYVKRQKMAWKKLNSQLVSEKQILSGVAVSQAFCPICNPHVISAEGRSCSRGWLWQVSCPGNLLSWCPAWPSGNHIQYPVLRWALAELIANCGSLSGSSPGSLSPLLVYSLGVFKLKSKTKKAGIPMTNVSLESENFPVRWA